MIEDFKRFAIHLIKHIQMASIYIENYGCTANYDDGAIIAGILTESGHIIVKDIEESDIVIINSCTVKNVTVNTIFRQIENVNETNKKLIITGCMPIAEKSKLDKLLKKGMGLVSTQNISKISNVVESVIANEQVVLTNKNKETKLGLPKIISDKRIASIQISHGCLSTCTFCSTKLAKGNLISYPKEQITEEVKKYADLGYKRINLTSTDNACYGFDLGYNLVDLLKEVVSIEGDFIIRVGMGNPEHTRKYIYELIEIYKNPKIMKFAHFPVQSGSNNILKEMKRNHTIEEFEEIVNQFRKEIPGISISTDIIVGYPTETEDDFRQTVEMVKRLKFEVMNISKFASRTGTRASKLKQLKTHDIKRRSIELTNVYNEIKQENKEIKKRLVVLN